MTIEHWRTQIDEIDRKLVKLMNDRAQCAIEIAEIKKQNKMNVVDPEREKNVFRNVENANTGPFESESLRRIFESIIEEIRQAERKVTGEK